MVAPFRQHCLHFKAQHAYGLVHRGLSSFSHVAHSSQQSGIEVRLAGGKLGLQRSELTTAGLKLHIISPKDVDEVMDWYIQRGMEDRDPYWSVLWASAAAMADLLTSSKHLVQGARVCDVGCGLGVSGIVAALCGASHVDLLDREPAALQCALLSAAANGIPVSTSAADFADTEDEAASLRDLEATLAAMATRGLASGTSEADRRCSGKGETTVVSARPFDWYLAHDGPPCDVIIACDVLYESFAVSPLARVLPTMLAQSPLRSQRMLLTDPPKRAAENRRRFMAELAERDSTMVVELNKVVQQPFEDGVTEVQVIVLRRKLGGETVGVPLTSVT